jgi:hypothetical protein
VCLSREASTVRGPGPLGSVATWINTWCPPVTHFGAGKWVRAIHLLSTFCVSTWLSYKDRLWSIIECRNFQCYLVFVLIMNYGRRKILWPMKTLANWRKNLLCVWGDNYGISSVSPEDPLCRARPSVRKIHCAEVVHQSGRCTVQSPSISPEDPLCRDRPSVRKIHCAEPVHIGIASNS